MPACSLLSIEPRWLAVDHVPSLIAQRIWQLNTPSPLLLTLVSPVFRPHHLADNCRYSYGLRACVFMCLFVIESSSQTLHNFRFRAIHQKLPESKPTRWKCMLTWSPILNLCLRSIMSHFAPALSIIREWIMSECHFNLLCHDVSMSDARRGNNEQTVSKINNDVGHNTKHTIKNI